MQRRILIAALSALAVSAALSLPAAHAAQGRGASHGVFGLVAFSGWQVDKGDNICGLDDARQLSNPVVVDYDRLLAATPEQALAELEILRTSLRTHSINQPT